MYKIDIKKDKPDIGYMEAVVSNLMADRGIRLNNCDNLSKYYNELKDALRNEISEKYFIDNPNSAKQVADFLEFTSQQFDLNSKNDIIDICYDSDKGKWTTSADALEKLADLGYDFAKDILDYRHAKKYAESIDGISKMADSDNIVHPLVTLSKTNRLQYSKPGLLTIPKKLLWNIIAPYKDGNTLYSVDIKNQEPSILINMTDSIELKEALKNDEGLYETMFKQCFKIKAVANILVDTFPENRVYSIEEIKSFGTISPASYLPCRPPIKDVYYNNERVIAIETICAGSEKGMHANLPNTVDIETDIGNIYSVDVEWESDDKKYNKLNDYTLTGELKDIEIRVGNAERKEFKVAWNAISYGASQFGIRMMCKTIDGNQVYNYITKINGMKEYRKKVGQLADKGITTIGTIFGTPLSAGYIEDSKKLKRVLLDLPIQGSAADILSLLIKRFYTYTSDKNISDKMSLYYTRHDELIIEVDKDWIIDVGEEYVESLLIDMLEHQINDWVPFKIEVTKTEASELNFINSEEE